MGIPELTRFIREVSLALGFSAVGIAPARPVPGSALKTWLGRGYQGTMDYLVRGAEKRLDPARVLHGARSTVSLALDYFQPRALPYEDPGQGVISRYASGIDYHRVMGGMLDKLLGSIREVNPDINGRAYVDSGPVLEKYWGWQAGLGWIGKHTNLISRQRGSWFFLGELLLDVELEFDSPAADYCGSCRKCIDACPTGAIVEPYVLDARRCISYLTIELRGEVDPALRGAMGNLVFGCDICQEVCPWNSKAPPTKRREFESTDLGTSLIDLAKLTPEEFTHRFRLSPVKRAKWSGFMRNLAIAMGNSSDPGFVRSLKDFVEAGDPLVRLHAEWALGRLKSGK